MSARTAVKAAHRLYATATGLFVAMTALLAITIAFLVVGFARTHDNTLRGYLVGAVLGALLTWAVLALLCFGAQAFAEHVELHAGNDDHARARRDH